MEDKPLTYEHIIRDAFGGADKCFRNRDPAGLAGTEYYNDQSIDSIKVALGYAAAVFAKRASLKSKTGDAAKAEDLLTRILAAKSIKDIDPILEDLSYLADEYAG